jgi:phosphoribosylformylglycinamidine synthase
MAASAVDEALRNCVAVGADPSHIAILDNFCWGYTDRPETLGTLVRAALACHDLALAFGTPFISGKDSLNNEFSYVDDMGHKRTIAIPPSLLVSAMGQIENVKHCTTMDFKQPGSLICLVGLTRNELGGSHLGLVTGFEGGAVPRVHAPVAKATLQGIHQAIQQGAVLACHDLSEGGLAVGIAEMAFAGGLGAMVYLDQVRHDVQPNDCIPATLLFSESNSRFLCEVSPEQITAFQQCFSSVPLSVVGEVTLEPRLRVYEQSGQANSNQRPVVDCEIDKLKQAWQAPLAW